MPLRAPLTQTLVEMTLRASNMMKSGEESTSATAETSSPATRAAARAPKPSEPPDPNPTPLIRSQNHQTLALRSRSNGSDLNIPLRAATFAKETLPFIEINPRSFLIQKYMQFSPKSFTDPPDLFKNRTHSPGRSVLRVRP